MQPSLSDLKIIIYGFGITGKWLSDNINCDFIIDTDSKKWGNVYNNKKMLKLVILFVFIGITYGIPIHFPSISEEITFSRVSFILLPILLL